MIAIAGLYVLVDPAACRLHGPVETARLALEGGASIIQWRDKLRDKGEQLGEARATFRLCQEYAALFIVNDDADLALAVGQPLAPVWNVGVHVGQKDLPVKELRRFLPYPYLVGASTNNVDEAKAAEAAGASYIAVGDVFGTASKEGTRVASPGRLAEVKRAVRLPVVGIGGINLVNAAEVVKAGADAIAVISAVCGADDPRQAAAQLVEAIARAK